MASEVINMAVRANIHMDFRVVEVADYKSSIKLNLRVFLKQFGGQLVLRQKLQFEVKCT